MTQPAVHSTAPDVPGPSDPGAAPRPWPLWVKCLITVALLWHFSAIIIHVVSTQIDQTAAPPPLALELNKYGRPYLRAIYITSSYRYFVPNPGAQFLLWFRITYKDGKEVCHRWVEFPNKETTGSWWLRMPYQRGLSISALLGQHMRFNPTDKKPRWFVDPTAQIWLASYARHVAQKYPHTKPDGKPWPVAHVDIYGLFHSQRRPIHVRNGWEADDLRLYGYPPTVYPTAYVPGTPVEWPIDLGTYAPDGVLATPEPRDPRGFVDCWRSVNYGVCDTIYGVTWQMLEDLDQPGSDVENLDLPHPVRKLLLTHSAELLDPRLRNYPDKRMDRLEEIVRKNDRTNPMPSGLAPKPRS